MGEVAVVRNYPDGSTFQNDKASIIAALREFVDGLEADDEAHPMRITFVMQTREGVVKRPVTVGIRTTHLEALGLLQWGADMLTRPKE